MFFHDKKLMFDVKVHSSDAQFAQMLLEQFGGATGELSAALTYWTQSFHVEDKAIRDMLHDIAIEEFSHLEMVGRMIEQHTEKATGAAKDAAYKSTLFAVRGIGPHLVDSQGQAWTSAYVNEGGNVVRDLRADIAAEAGARQTYEALIKLSPDAGSTKALTFLLTREISHTNMFMKALDALGKLTDPNVRQHQAGRDRRPIFQPVKGRPARCPRPLELRTEFPLCRPARAARRVAAGGEEPRRRTPCSGARYGSRSARGQVSDASRRSECRAFDNEFAARARENAAARRLATIPGSVCSTELREVAAWLG